MFMVICGDVCVVQGRGYKLPVLKSPGAFPSRIIGTSLITVPPRLPYNYLLYLPTPQATTAEVQTSN